MNDTGFSLCVALAGQSALLTLWRLKALSVLISYVRNRHISAISATATQVQQFTGLTAFFRRNGVALDRATPRIEITITPD